MHHGRSLYSMINSGFHGPLHSVFEHLTYKDPRDWKRDWEREEKGREVGPIWAYLNKCQQSLWAPVGITWISSGSSFWWKLPWRWQEVLMRLPRIRNTMSLPKCCRGPHALASLPLCFLAQETESFQQSLVLTLISDAHCQSGRQTLKLVSSFALLPQQSYSPGNVHTLTD